MSMFWATCKSELSLFPITFISGLFRSGDQDQRVRGLGD